MRKRKERDSRKQTLDAGVYPVVQFHKVTPTFTLLNHLLRVLLLDNQVSSADSTTVSVFTVKPAQGYP